MNKEVESMVTDHNSVGKTLTFNIHINIKNMLFQWIYRRIEDTFDYKRILIRQIY